MTKIIALLIFAAVLLAPFAAYAAISLEDDSVLLAENGGAVLLETDSTGAVATKGKLLLMMGE